MSLRTVLAFLAASFLAGAQTPMDRPWQRVQMPSGAFVAAHWKTPPPEYGPEPYYGLNGPVSLEVVRRDLDTMKRLGFSAVTVQYGAGAPFGYLSPEYFQFFREFVAEAKRRDIRIWIVDDAGYPSGFAGGKLASEHPELRMQALIAEKTAVASGAIYDEPVKADAAVVTAIRSDGQMVDLPIHEGHVRWQAPNGSWTVYVVEHVFRTSPTRSETNPKHTKDTSLSLEDYLNPAATAEFLRLTHEAYKQVVGNEFGKTILGFRGDEPDYSIAGLPWTPDFFARFVREKGYDVRPYLAALLQGKDAILTPRQMGAKADYWDVFANLFRDGFFKPQGEWCAANKLEYQVHLNHEERQLQLVRSEGDFFRDMRYVQVPGIDAIWHQIWTDTISDYPRLAASAAHVYGRPRAFTESFAAYRPAPDVTMARYILNEQFVRGINLVEAMYFPATSTAGRGGPMELMRDPAFPSLMQYSQRLSYLMAMGRPAASTALLLPTASLWMGDTEADDTFVSAERLLSEHQVDFDIVTEDAVNSVLKPGKGTLQSLSGNGYRAVIIPDARVLSAATVDRLRAFAAGGGHVLFLRAAPAQIAERTYLKAHAASTADFDWVTVAQVDLGMTPTPPAYPPSAPPQPQQGSPELLKALRRAVPSEDLELTSPSTALRYTHRRLADATVFLFFNESSAPLNDRVKLHVPEKHAQIWDPQTASIKEVEGVSRDRYGVELDLQLAPYATKVIVLR